MFGIRNVPILGIRDLPSIGYGGGDALNHEGQVAHL